MSVSAAALSDAGASVSAIWGGRGWAWGRRVLRHHQLCGQVRRRRVHRWRLLWHLWHGVLNRVRQRERRSTWCRVHGKFRFWHRRVSFRFRRVSLFGGLNLRGFRFGCRRVRGRCGLGCRICWQGFRAGRCRDAGYVPRDWRRDNNAPDKAKRDHCAAQKPPLSDHLAVSCHLRPRPLHYLVFPIITRALQCIGVGMLDLGASAGACRGTICPFAPERRAHAAADR